MIDAGAWGNTIGGIADGGGNTIAFNQGDGVEVNGAGTTGNSIRGNSIYSNGRMGIDQGINNINDGNDDLAAPTVASTASAKGTACRGCDVDIFSDDKDEGRIFEGSTTASTASGVWRFPGPVTGPSVTTTATDGSGNTSEFSPPLEVCIWNWPSITVNTLAKGQSVTNNRKVSHEITGNAVGGDAAYGPTAHRIKLCWGTAISINITGAGTTVTGDCDTTNCTIVAVDFMATRKYQVVSADGKDTDRITLIPILP